MSDEGCNLSLDENDPEPILEEVLDALGQLGDGEHTILTP
jgi:hypothetical protein